MKSSIIRDKFIQFFVTQGHYHVPAVSIINKADPSLLFVNAGMNPFKDILLGNEPIIQPRVASAQPCLRVSGKHNDLEEVGVDTYHHTLFEMLGNWSFGDYFKEAAIQWAWELLTELYKLPKAQIYVTIFGGDGPDGLPKDEEAAAIWRNYLPAAHILAFGKKDNFWEMGAQGPCGPCSEIHIDIRPLEARNAIPAAELVNTDHPQVIEIWNLVFMQYNRLATGKLVELPYTHIDTGMGFERLAMILQGKHSSYDSDIFTPLIAKVEALSGKKYQQDETTSIAMRVIVDHIRAVSFAIADGQAPAATKAGYVIRRILRRAMRYGYSHLNIQTPFMHQLVALLVEQMGHVYRNLSDRAAYITEMIYGEEKTFLRTLSTGLQRFHQLTLGATPGTEITGGVAFELYDTHGFPLDLTRLISREKGLSLDEEGFQEALQQQRARAQKDREATQGDWQIIQQGKRSSFVGYDQLVTETSIIQWRTIESKQMAAYQIVLEETPFYPEGGGQAADRGRISIGNQVIEVVNVQKEHGLILHTVATLPTSVNQSLIAKVDITKRQQAACNHTATHLLHGALKRTLGAHVVQKGSSVTPDLLRFDFSHPTKLTATELASVERMVNRKIRENISCVEQRNMPLESAKAMGAQALFGEKYGSEVRVITFDPSFSVELCGGTHVSATGDIGFFKLIAESAIGTGVRRIEAVTAEAAEAFVAERLSALTDISMLLKQPKDIVQAVNNLAYERKQWQKERAAYEMKAVEQVSQQLEQYVEADGGIHLLLQCVDISVDGLKQLAFHFQKKYVNSVIALGAKVGEQAHLLLLISKSLQATHHAHEIIQAVAPIIGGNGGGHALFAVAGGNFPMGIPEALLAIRSMVMPKGQ